MKPRLMLSLTNAAKDVGMSVRHFRREYTEKNGKFFQIGRSYFILTKDLEEWKQMRASQ